MPESEPHINIDEVEKLHPEMPSADTDRTLLEKENLRRRNVARIDSLPSLQIELAPLVGKYIRKYYDEKGDITQIDVLDKPSEDPKEFLKGLHNVKPEHPGLG